MRTKLRFVSLAALPVVAVLAFTPPANVSSPDVTTALESLRMRVVDLERDNAILRAHLNRAVTRVERAHDELAAVAARLDAQSDRIDDHDDRLADGLDRMSRLEAEPAARPVAAGGVRDLEREVRRLSRLLTHVRLDGDDLYVEGANLHVVNGLGSTASTNGLGNLIVGYNESRGGGDDRSGSHRVVLGSRNNYAGFGGIVAGTDNDVAGPWSSVLGGTGNRAEGSGAVVSGGAFNVATGRFAAVGGGMYNEAGGDASAVTRGCASVVTTCGGD